MKTKIVLVVTAVGTLVAMMVARTGVFANAPVVGVMKLGEMTWSRPPWLLVIGALVLVSLLLDLAGRKISARFLAGGAAGFLGAMLMVGWQWYYKTLIADLQRLGLPESQIAEIVGGIKWGGGMIGFVVFVVLFLAFVVTLLVSWKAGGGGEGRCSAKV